MKATMQIWYMRPEFFLKGTFGAQSTRLLDTHVHLKDVTVDLLDGPMIRLLEKVWQDMQAENWSPNGEANTLIEAKGLGHTSMSVGDVIVVARQPWVAAMTGFALMSPDVLPEVTHPELPQSERDLLDWLGRGDYSQYGECFGDSLNHLVSLGLAQIHAPGEHQGGFIAQDHTGTRGMKFRAVSLTDAGRDALKALTKA